MKRLILILASLSLAACGATGSGGASTTQNIPSPTSATPDVPNVVSPVVVAPTPTPVPTPPPVVALACNSVGYSGPNGIQLFNVYCTGGNLGSAVVELDMQKIVMNSYLTPFAITTLAIVNSASNVCLSGHYSDTNPIANSSLSFNACGSVVSHASAMYSGEEYF